MGVGRGPQWGGAKMVRDKDGDVWELRDSGRYTCIHPNGGDRDGYKDWSAEKVESQLGPISDMNYFPDFPPTPRRIK